MKPVYRMSNVGTCPRALSAQRLGYQPEDIPKWLEETAKEGKMHEEWIVRNYIKGELNMEIAARQREVAIELPSLNIVGHIEGLAKQKSTTPDATPWHLFEIKSMSQYEFDRWMRGGFEEFPSYADQITCYMNATGIFNVLYIVKNRSSGYKDVFWLDKPPSSMQGIEAKLESIETRVTGHNMLQEADCNFSTIECKRCFYKYLCVQTKEDYTVQTENVLLAAAEKWRIGKMKEKQGSAMVNEAKKILEEHLTASGLPDFRFANLAISQINVREHEVPAHIKAAYSYIKIEDLTREES